MKLKVGLIALVVVALAGCQSSGTKTPTQKEQAVEKWNQTRASVLASLARSQFETGHLDKSEQTLGEAMRLDPKSSTLHVLAAHLAIEQGKLEDAQKELTTASQLDPKNAEADYLMGIVYQRWQKPQDAYDCYARASQKQPTDPAYVLAEAEALVSLNRTQDALDLIESQLDHFEHNPVLRHAAGKLQMNLGHNAEAIASLHTAKMLAPDDLTIAEDLAMAYYDNHQYYQAADAFRYLLSSDSQSGRSGLWIAMGECQLQINSARDARNSFDKATQLDPSNVRAWLSLAKVTLQLGDTHRARIDSQKALSLDIACAEAHLMLGYISLRENRMTEALAEFQKSAALDPNDSVSLCMVGFVLEKTGKPQQAVEYYAKALKLKPKDELASRLMASVDLSQ